ncbi:DNA topoisomerase 2-binding protein 1 [Gurleya vavrai]
MSHPVSSNTVYFTTTAISNLELDLVLSFLPSNFSFESSLSSRTSFLITYRCNFTEKYIQALKWKLPIIHIEWLYDTKSNKKQFILNKLQGSCFSVSNVSNDVFGKYCELLGAEWKEDLDRSVDFLISENINEKKINEEKINLIKKNFVDENTKKDLFNEEKDLINRSFVVENKNKLYKENESIDKNFEIKNLNKTKDTKVNKNLEIKNQFKITTEKIKNENTYLQINYEVLENQNNVSFFNKENTTNSSKKEKLNFDKENNYVRNTENTPNTLSEKVEYALKQKIPIINPNDIFNNNWLLFKKEHKFEAIRKESAIFTDLTFFLDSNLPIKLFNLVKRIIIENKGVRVCEIDKNVDYIITSLKGNFLFKNEKIRSLHYQFILDCCECKAFLYPNYYLINESNRKLIFENITCYIDKNLIDYKNVLVNKINAMGGIVKNFIEEGVTHVIVKNKKEYKMNNKDVPYKVVLYDWIDQCLFNCKLMKEDKYLVKKPVLNLFKIKCKEKSIKEVVSYSNNEKETVFQFTGLASSLKNKAIEKLDSLNVKYYDGDKLNKCTHLIMGTINTSEKFMCALSQGLWILIPDVIDKYDGTANFNFLLFEWKIDDLVDKNEIKIISAVEKWRKRVSETGKYAFDGWKVKFYCEENKKNSLNLLITSGGGFITEENDATHVFVSKKFFNSVQEEKYYSINYIYSHLLK